MTHIPGRDYGVAHEGGIWFDHNPEKVHLADFGFRLCKRFLYEYDFYDLWEHDVRLEKFVPWKCLVCPVCTGGKRMCPPENCGGPRAFMEQGDPRWRERSDVPREDWAFMAETMQRLLDTDDDLPAPAMDRERLLVALERVKASSSRTHHGFAPEPD